MGCLSPKYIAIHQKGSYPPWFSTLEERAKEDPWGDTWKIQILGQDESLEVVGNLLTPTKSPPQIPTNLGEVRKYAAGSDIMRKKMAKIWSSEYLLVWYKRELLVWHHRMNHCSLKHLLRLPKKGIIPRNIRKVRHPHLCCLYVWKLPQEAMEDQRQKIRRVDQETIGDQNRGHDLNWPDGIWPTRDHPPSHWGYKTRNILGIHRICGSLLRPLLCSPHEGNLILGNPLGQGILQDLDSHPRVQGLRLQGGQ